MIVPVIDLMGGVVVRGIAGRRDEYRPIVSQLIASSQPIAVARAFREHFGLSEFYVADLDAIGGGEPAFAIYAALHTDGFRLSVDAGVRTVDDAKGLHRRCVSGIVIGLETVDGPATVAAICREIGASRVLFSLDLKNGEPLGDHAAWQTGDAWSLAQRVIAEGITRMIVLDLARVGVGEGAGTEALCTQLRRDYPRLEITAGGGVRGPDDLARLAAIGVDQVLVASALHDGRLSADALRQLTRSAPQTPRPG